MAEDSAAQIPANGLEAETADVPAPPPPNPLLDKYNEQWAAVQQQLDDFHAWTALLSTAEKLDVLTHIQAAYDGFLAAYPLCFGYWKKYAAAEKRHSGDAAAIAVLERGVAAVPYSVDLWLHYALFQQGREDSSVDDVRSVYERAVAYVGTDFNAHTLWDKWLAYETVNGTPQHIAALYLRIMGCPIKELERYHNSLKEFAGVRTIGELLPPDQIDALRAVLPPLPPKAPAPPPSAPAAAAEPAGEAMDTDAATAPGEEAAAAGEAVAAPAPDAAAATTAAPADAADADATGTAGAQTTPQPPASAADTNAEASAHAEGADAAAAEEEGEEARLKDAWLQRCEAAYTAAAAELSWRTPFEEAIKRYYFHIKPLDAAQQANWSSYLEAAEGRLGDQEGGLAALVVLYERCLVPCARYPEFWQRYIRLLEAQPSLGASAAHDALLRATQRTFCGRRTEMQLFAARFLECSGDVEGARKAYALVLGELSLGLLEALVASANFERRHGSREAACAAFDAAISTARDNLTPPTANGTPKAHDAAAAVSTYGFLCMQYAYFLRVAFADVAAARKVLEQGLAAAPSCRALWEGAIWFEESMDGGCAEAAAARTSRVLELYERALTAVDSKAAQAAQAADGEAAAGASQPALSEQDREELSVRSVEYADAAGDVAQLAAAEARHAKRFPRLMRGGASASSTGVKRAYAEAGMGAPSSKQARVAEPAAGAAPVSAAPSAYFPPPPVDPAAAAYGADPYAGYYAQQHYAGYHGHQAYPPYY